MNKLKAISISLVTGALMASSALASSFINPLNYDGSFEQKRDVIEFIYENSSRLLCSRIDLPRTCELSFIQLFVRDEWEAFKYLATEVKNENLFKMVLRQYASDPNYVSYSTLKLMYDKANER